MRKLKQTTALLIASLAISSCAPALAEYCDLAQGPVQFDNPASVPQLISLGERESLEQIDANNRVGERKCGWVVQ